MKILANVTSSYRGINWNTTRSEAAKHINGMLGVARAKNLMASASASAGSPQAYLVELTEGDHAADWSLFGCALVDHNGDKILVTPAPVGRQLRFDFGINHLAEALGYDFDAWQRSAVRCAFAARLKNNLQAPAISRKTGATYMNDRIGFLNKAICRASGISGVQGKFKRALRDALECEKPRRGLTEAFARQIFSRITGHAVA